MNTALWWDNLVAYSLQIGLLVGVAALVPALLRMVLPKARLMYWHVLLAACLLLPLARPWKQAIIIITTPAATPVETAPPVAAPPARTRWTPGELALLLLAAGALARVGWLAVGLVRLRRYRKHSAPWRGPAVVLGPRPEYRICDDIGSPVTFGLRQPVVLLPGNFDELPLSMQEAVLCHEALHVERSDWAVTVVEELVRAVFWFHPAIWWLLGEIQLAREQAVDREVVERTQARDAYVDTLLAVAGARMEMDLAPAPLFLRKRHLKQRVLAVVKEARMSRIRLISTLTAGLAMLAAVCWLVTAAFPLAAAPQMVADGPGVTVEMNAAQLMHRTAVRYPADAISKGVQGTVVAQVRLDAGGNVVDATILSGPDELRKTVLQSVLSWHFSKDLGGSTQSVSVSFQLPKQDAAPTVAPAPTYVPRSYGQVISSAPTTPPGNPNVLISVNVLGLSDQARSDLLAILPAHVGDTVSADMEEKVAAAARAFDEHLLPAWGTMNGGARTLTIAPTSSGAVLNAQVNVSESRNMPKRVLIGDNVQAGMLIYGPKPQYPPLAKQARVSGSVTLHAFISETGEVQSLAVVPPAHPLLAPAAMEAVRQWRYKPTLLNGEPVAVETNITVSFSLQE
jgi:TonB family protein